MLKSYKPVRFYRLFLIYTGNLRNRRYILIRTQFNLHKSSSECYAIFTKTLFGY